ncbi:hypothetical protein MTO96_049807 [Rhipicephalus appendiculatus]
MAGCKGGPRFKDPDQPRRKNSRVSVVDRARIVDVYRRGGDLKQLADALGIHIKTARVIAATDKEVSKHGGGSKRKFGDDVVRTLSRIVDENCTFTLRQIKEALEKEMPGVTISASTADRLLDAHSYSVKLVTQRPADCNLDDVRRLCDEVAEEDARPTALSVEPVGVARPSGFRDWQSLFGKRGEYSHHATRGEQTVHDVVAEVIVRAGIRHKWVHFPWMTDEKGAFKNVSWDVSVIGCVDDRAAIIIAPNGDHHKAASYRRMKHYAHIIMLVNIDLPILSCTCLRSEMCLIVVHAFVRSAT